MAKASVEDIDRHIGRRLKLLRQEHGISAAQLAEAIDSTQQQISRYENGFNKMSAAQLFRLAYCLNVPLSWFFLDFNPVDLPLKQFGDTRAGYLATNTAEEVELLRLRWPHLKPAQRETVLKLVDTFAQVG